MRVSNHRRPSSRLPREDRDKKRLRAATIDKSVLSLPASRRIRDRDHVRLVAKQPCLICGRHPADAHHLRFAQSRTLAAKSAMSSQSPCVVAIIARSTAAAMKWHGGKRWALIRLFPLVLCGWKAIHYPQRVVTNKAGQNPTGESNRVETTKRSHFLMWAANDLRQTVRGQPSQLSQEHRS